MKYAWSYGTIIFLLALAEPLRASGAAEIFPIANWRTCTSQKAVELYHSTRQPFDRRLRNAIVELALSQCDYDLIDVRTIQEHQSLAEVARQQETEFKHQRKSLRSMIQSLADKDALEGL